MPANNTPPLRKPDWLRVRLSGGKEFSEIKQLVKGQNLHTVCEEAMCPNIHECWGKHKTATFMILGEVCTRACRFCAVATGRPPAPDPDEPRRVAESVATMGLEHVVITMVTRDDLPDGGAQAVADTVIAIREASPDCSVEVLASDMLGDREAIKIITDSMPAVNSHNLETVRRLTQTIRSRSDYDRSLSYLRIVKEIDPGATTKSSLMLGLGETRDEILQSMDDLRGVDVDVMNMGQYLQPTKTHAPVEKFWTPEEFTDLKEEALSRGFTYCESAPLVRSSYHAGAQYAAFLKQARDRRGTS
ncbi:MAG: lipoyl synthase [Kiritimatiellia bacterium]|jgi:lipoic acid synthetase|nr:lipoyl synthase [Kiritimatiellia bacterium]MDP6810030.1 lipoyl synthase [Kiritimatiellia bacterium]MDP7024801.1 lipoyl synthase [Kiritimatiellia bacterium]